MHCNGIQTFLAKHAFEGRGHGAVALRSKWADLAPREMGNRASDTRRSPQRFREGTSMARLLRIRQAKQDNAGRKNYVGEQ